MVKTKPSFKYLSKKMKIKNNKELKDSLLSKCKEFNFDQLARDTELFLYYKEEIQKIKLFPEYISNYL